MTTLVLSLAGLLSFAGIVAFIADAAKAAERIRHEQTLSRSVDSPITQTVPPRFEDRTEALPKRA